MYPQDFTMSELSKDQSPTMQIQTSIGRAVRSRGRSKLPVSGQLHKLDKNVLKARSSSASFKECWGARLRQSAREIILLMGSEREP